MPVASRIFLGSQSSPSPGLFEHDLQLDEVFGGYGKGLVNGGDFPGWSLLIDGRSPDHAAVVLQSPDGTPLRESRRLLLSLWSEHRNTGMVWNQDQTSVDDRWGGAPTVIRPVEARLVFAFPASVDLRVYPLDSVGRRGTPVARSAEEGPGVYRIDTGRDRTVWYELELSAPVSEIEYSVDEGGLTSVVGIPAVAPRERWWLPARHEGAASTAVALVNPSLGESPAVRLTLLEAEGSARDSLDLSIRPGSVEAFFPCWGLSTVAAFSSWLRYWIRRPAATKGAIESSPGSSAERDSEPSSSRAARSRSEDGFPSSTSRASPWRRPFGRRTGNPCVLLPVAGLDASPSRPSTPCGGGRLSIRMPPPPPLKE